MLDSERNIFKEGLNTEITQGSVFINAYSAIYTASVNYGLIITARCDISQRKARIHSYLPIVSLGDWLSNDFPRILDKRARSQVESSLVAQFEAIGGSSLLLKTYGAQKIKDYFIDSPPNNKQKKFLESLEKFELLSSLDDAVEDLANPVLYLKNFEKISSNILRDLIGQNISGFYFLDDVCGDGPHVILLREIYHLSERDAYDLRYGCRIWKSKLQ